MRICSTRSACLPGVIECMIQESRHQWQDADGITPKDHIGDISFLDDIDSRTIKVAASKGRTVCELSLNSKDAQAKSV